MAGHRIKIGTYNVNNFFDRFDDPYSRGDDHWGPRATKPKSLSELFSLGARLREDKPDILAVQEVENKGAFHDFNVAQLGDHFKDITIIESNDERGIQVGLGSTFPIGKVVSYQFLRDVADSRKGKIFSRDLIEVEILDPDTYYPLLTIFVTHLKSKFVNPTLRGDARQKEEERSDKRRQRQAMALALIIKNRFYYQNGYNVQALQSWNYAVMGDLNDTPDSTALAPLIQDRDLALYDVLSHLKPENRWTHYWDKEKKRSQFDYILLSPALRARMVPGTAHVIQRGHTTGSDHRPVYVDVNVG